MSDSISSASSEVEAQQSLLTETRGLLCDEDDDHNNEHPAAETIRGGGVDMRALLRRVILLLRSTEYFKLGAKNYNPTIPPSPPPPPPPHQDSEIGVITADSTHEIGISASDGQSVTINIEDLQQRKSIAEIVRNKNLNDLRNFKGGVKRGIEGVAEALNTDLEKGISIPEQTLHSHHPNDQLYKFLVILLHSFLEASNNCTIFLLSTAAILSLSFGVNEDDMHGFGWFNGTVLISNVFLIIIFTAIHNCWQEWTSVKKLDNLGRIKKVRTVRGGNDQLIGETDLVVGDIVNLRKGDQVPGDGLFVISTRAEQPLELNDGSPVDGNTPSCFTARE